MKIYLTLPLLLLLEAPSATAQIPTPDFKYYSSCPTNFSQVSNCRGWVQPTGGTSDYFNVCANRDVDVPQNLFGYQTAASNAYTGLFAYAPLSMPDYKEYIGTNFAPLTIGQTYTMTIRVSLSDSSNYATDGLGVYFTTYAVNDPSLYTTLLVTPQVDYSSYGTIKDKVNWVTLSKSFVADSAYTHLVVGCFKAAGTLQIDSVGNAGKNYMNGKYAYYYIGQIGEPDSTRHDSTDFLTPSDTFKIVSTDTAEYRFPNAFTPNNDTHNDVFRIISMPGIVYKDYVLSIFNRWGQRVFISRDPIIGWDGTFNGTPQDMETYFYLAEFTINTKRERLKGDVILVR